MSAAHWQLSSTGCRQADAAAESKPVLPVAVAAPAPAADTLSDSLLIARADRGRLMGRDSGAIWVVMISDFQCPYCKQWHDASMANLQRDYVTTGQIRLAYLNLPLPQHKHARTEALAALCAGVQDRFWPFAEQLFARQEEVERAMTVQPLIDTIARGLSLDMDAFGRCQQRQAIRALMESDVQQANKTGVRSTPSFLVGEFLVEGAVPYPDFRKAIDTALVLARSAKRTR
ncbi:MAG: thioredoxin domain-containing protein [Gemmatimonadaceae bacterium]|nr:thioredoxin domain-containing protein [Gemmatimonadaceae bacterium]